MKPKERPRLPAGHPPWETFAGIRIGGFVGAIVGVIVTLLLGAGGVWVTLAGAVVGAAVGYASAKLQQRMPRG